MDYDELNYFSNLPEKITIYRGGVSKRGISWTLDKYIAEWFANRFKAINKFLTKYEKKHYLKSLNRINLTKNKIINIKNKIF